MDTLNQPGAASGGAGERAAPPQGGDESQERGGRGIGALDRSAVNGSQGGKLVDMMTLAGLMQWCARAIRSVGRDNLETLVKVSMMTGRLSQQTTNVMLALVPLFDSDEGGSVSAREVISLMVQLDSLLSLEAGGDARMLSLMFMEDADPFAALARTARQGEAASARARRVAS